MKPINLEIKGFNSFRDKQVIDFEKLTSKGLFGIFGPTGSGKSSILDGIIYALYGKVTREQGSFMNSNETETLVTFTFEIGKEKSKKRYVISRHVKRQKSGENGNPNVRLYEENSDGERIVLADRAKSATEVIEGIIGLELNDFTRAVVLPQGKFSEFLKMRPLERNNMLERIFGLEKYGKQLSDKVRARSKLNTDRLNLLQGELNGYEGVSQEALDNLNVEFAQLASEEEQFQIKEKKFNDIFSEKQQIYNLQNELQEYLLVKTKLIEQEVEVKNLEVKLERAESASCIKPTYDDFTSLNNSNEQTLTELEDVSKDLVELQKESSKLTELLKDAQLIHDTKLPGLKVKEEKLIEGQKTLLEISAKEEEILRLNNEIEMINNVLNSNNFELVRLNKVLNENSEHISNLKIKIGQVSVSSKRRNEITRGYELQKETNSLLENLTKNEEFLSTTTKSKQEKIAKIDKLNLRNIELDSQKTNLSGQLIELKSTPIAKEQDVIELTEKINASKNFIESIQKSIEVKNELTKELEQIINEVDELRDTFQLKRDLLGEQVLAIKILNDQIETVQRNNMAGILASHLHDGGECPVCGNENHIKLAQAIDESELDKVQAQLRISKENERQLDSEISKLDAQIGVKIERQEKLISEKTLLDKFTLEMLNLEKLNMNSLLETRSSMIESKQKIETSITNLTESDNILKNEIDKVQTDLKVEEVNVSNLNDKIKVLEQEILQIKTKIGENKRMLLDISESEQDYIVLFKELRTNDSLLDDYNEQLKKLDVLRLNYESGVAETTKTINNEKLMLVQFEERLTHLNKDVQEMTEEVSTLCGEVPLEELLEQVRDEISLNTKNVSDLREKLSVASEKLSKTSNSKVSLEAQALQNQSRLTDLDNKLSNLLRENNFTSLEEVIEHFTDEKQKLLWKDEISKFKDELNRVQGIIDNTKSKLGNRSVTSEEWEELQVEKVSLDATKLKLTEDKSVLRRNITDMSERLDKVKDIRSDYERVRHDQDLVDHLTRLIQGNKFVEYVAMSQLNYVAKEASKRLNEITKGKFDLLLDKDDGSFQIKDNSSGGHIRSTDTLSGGELFLTSLSLALALSSHIQLKNSAPLEFFFLDEGFGTLDENILEVALLSLEKLHSEDLCVGIISHVKEIQERLPLKLIVSPAILGDGSTVTLS